MRALIDSDVLVDYLQGRSEAADELARYAECCISLISWMEVMVGAGNDVTEEEVCRRFLESFRVLPVTEKVAERTVRLRRSHRLKLPDAIVWASAQEEACLLVTRNTKDFPADDAGVRFPYRI
jgi:predicted nucleic acid-binding protein